jgi:hypothetical protein
MTSRDTNDERWLSESEATDFLVGTTRVMLDRAYRTTVRDGPERAVRSRRGPVVSGLACPRDQ